MDTDDVTLRSFYSEGSDPASSLILPMMFPALIFCFLFMFYFFSRKFCRGSVDEQGSYDEEEINEKIENAIIIREWQADAEDENQKEVEGKSGFPKEDSTETISLSIDDGEDDNDSDSNDNDRENMERSKSLVSKLRRLRQRMFTAKKKDNENKDDDNNDAAADDDDDGSIVIDIVGEVDSSNLGCAICLKKFKHKDLVSESKNTSCQHMFHRECILPWLHKQNCCPLCKEKYMV